MPDVNHYSWILWHPQCNKHARRRLWEFLLSNAQGSSNPWIIVGDFNIVAAREEKIRGDQSRNDGGIREFNEFMITAGVFDLGFQGSPHTWTNNQEGACRVWVRLERVLLNGACLATFPGLRVTHLNRGTSDHIPLLIQLETMV
uniref:Endonuclease/exonuclease/phosphatase domain-containing protein n=1 Tax=Kalanchoe fedtschenkoi TaxID=63787 RepID=A0A7N0TUS8_KALFE